MHHTGFMFKLFVSVCLYYIRPNSCIWLTLDFINIDVRYTTYIVLDICCGGNIHIIQWQSKRVYGIQVVTVSIINMCVPSSSLWTITIEMWPCNPSLYDVHIIHIIVHNSITINDTMNTTYIAVDNIRSYRLTVQMKGDMITIITLMLKLTQWYIKP